MEVCIQYNYKIIAIIGLATVSSPPLPHKLTALNATEYYSGGINNFYYPVCIFIYFYIIIIQFNPKVFWYSIGESELNKPPPPSLLLPLRIYVNGYIIIERSLLSVYILRDDLSWRRCGGRGRVSGMECNCWLPLPSLKTVCVWMYLKWHKKL